MTQHSSAVEKIDEEADFLELEEGELDQVELNQVEPNQVELNQVEDSPELVIEEGASNDQEQSKESDSLDELHIIGLNKNVSSSSKPNLNESLSTSELAMSTALDEYTSLLNLHSEQYQQQSPEEQFASGIHCIKSEENHYLGAKWFQKAGMQGHAKAQFYLGLMFIKGEGVPKSLFHAYCWLTMASCQNLDVAKQAQKNLEPYLTTADISASSRLAAERIEQILAI